MFQQLLFVFAWTAAVSAHAQNTTPGLAAPKAKRAYVARSLSAGLPCANRIQDTLTMWKSQEKWEMAGVDLDGGRMYRTPTKELGVWIQAKVRANKAVELARITENSNVVAEWNVNDCKPTLKTHESALRAPQDGYGSFRDGHLRRLMREKKGGIIYVWSPHMKLSMRGLPEAQRLAQQRGLQFTAVCDPGARGPAKAKALKENNWPKSYGRAMNSVDLAMRGMTIHYPTMILYQDQKITSPMLPGYEAPKLLGAFVEKYTR